MRGFYLYVAIYLMALLIITHFCLVKPLGLTPLLVLFGLVGVFFFVVAAGAAISFFAVLGLVGRYRTGKLSRSVEESTHGDVWDPWIDGFSGGG